MGKDEMCHIETTWVLSNKLQKVSLKEIAIIFQGELFILFKVDRLQIIVVVAKKYI